MVFLTEKALSTKGGGRLTVQCSAYLILKWSTQNTTDLRDAKKASFHLTFHQVFLLTLFGNCSWRVIGMETQIQGKGNALYVLEVKEVFASLFE